MSGKNVYKSVTNVLSLILEISFKVLRAKKAANDKEMNKIISILILLLIVCIGLSYEQNQQKGDENCETMPSEIHLIKEEYDELGRLQRTCNGEVFVNKCEGLCNSQVQPSVITPTGFLKV